MNVFVMRMFRWISGNTSKDWIRNEEFRLRLRVTPIDEKMGESRLR